MTKLEKKSISLVSFFTFAKKCSFMQSTPTFPMKDTNKMMEACFDLNSSQTI
jgi:hypothetical protein